MPAPALDLSIVNAYHACLNCSNNMHANKKPTPRQVPIINIWRRSRPIALFNCDRIVVPKFGAPQLEQSGPMRAKHPGASFRHAKIASLARQKIYIKTIWSDGPTGEQTQTPEKIRNPSSLVFQHVDHILGHMQQHWIQTSSLQKNQEHHPRTHGATIWQHAWSQQTQIE